MISKLSIAAALLLLSSCSHICPTPADIQAENDKLRHENQTLRKDLKEAEDDLSTCIERVKDCVPLVHETP